MSLTFTIALFYAKLLQNQIVNKILVYEMGFYTEFGIAFSRQGEPVYFNISAFVIYFFTNECALF